MSPFKDPDRISPHRSQNVTLFCMAACMAGALVPAGVAWACRQPMPPPSFCGGPQCGTVHCNQVDISWECNYTEPGISCTGGFCDGQGNCVTNPPIQSSTYYGGVCGCIDAQWTAPRGALVLINSGGSSAIRTIIDNLGETFTHEMVVQGPGSASQSEYQGPSQTSDCDHPIDANSLEFGYPGMEISLNSGAIFADIYGRGGVSFSQTGTQAVVWQLGDASRASAIAAALDAVPVVVSTPHPINSTNSISLGTWHGATSPYGLYQYFNIEGTNLGESGYSTNNTTVSSTFCAWAYAHGGPPMTSYNYNHQETVNAANAFWNNVYGTCQSGLPWIVKSGLASLFASSCQSSIICNNAAAMVVNCTAVGGTYCDNNNNFFWQSTLTPANSHANSISPDRLGGLTRFSTEVPRPTTWATDVTHPVAWNGAGKVCGCFE